MTTMDASRKADIALWTFGGINIATIIAGIGLNKLAVAGSFVFGSIVTVLLIYLYIRYSIQSVLEGEALERITQFIGQP